MLRFDAFSRNVSTINSKVFSHIWWNIQIKLLRGLFPGEKVPIVPTGQNMDDQPIQCGHKWQSYTMSKIETTSKVSLKLTSSINLGRRGASTPSSWLLTQPTSPERAKGTWKGASLKPIPKDKGGMNTAHPPPEKEHAPAHFIPGLQENSTQSLSGPNLRKRHTKTIGVEGGGGGGGGREGKGKVPSFDSLFSSLRWTSPWLSLTLTS